MSRLFRVETFFRVFNSVTKLLPFSRQRDDTIVDESSARLTLDFREARDSRKFRFTFVTRGKTRSHYVSAWSSLEIMSEFLLTGVCRHVFSILVRQRGIWGYLKADEIGIKENYRAADF